MSSDVEGELIEDINGLWLWKTADGRQVAIREMPDTHLRNCGLFLMGMGYRKCIADDRVRIVWLKILRTEWERRMLHREMAKRWTVEIKEKRRIEGEVLDGSKQLR